MKNPKLFLVRHGQTYFNLDHRLGGDSPLTEEGIKHAQKIAEYLKEVHLTFIYTSLLQRSIKTAKIIKQFHRFSQFISTPELNEIENGHSDLMTYSEFEKAFPRIAKARRRDKYNTRFPRGENYDDITRRIMPLVEILKEETENCLIVGHQSVNRCVLGHLCGLPKEEIPHIVTPNDVFFEINLQNPKEVFHVKDGKRKEGYRV